MGAAVAAEPKDDATSKYDFRAMLSLGALGLGTYLLMTYDPVKKMDLSSRHLRDHDEFGNLKKPKGAVAALKGGSSLPIKTVAPAKRKPAMATGEEDIEDDDDEDDENDEDIDDDFSDLDEDEDEDEDGDVF